MNTFIKFCFQILASILGIWLAALYVPSIQFTGTWPQLVIAGLVLGIVNIILKPILKIISSPFIVLTLGLFTIIINMFLLWLTTRFVPELSISDLAGYFWGSIIISVLNFIFHII